MKRVTVVSTGGTIASGKAKDQSVVADRNGATLMARLHDRLEGIAVTVDDFTAVGSYALDLPTVRALIGVIGAGQMPAPAASARTMHHAIVRFDRLIIASRSDSGFMRKTPGA